VKLLVNAFGSFENPVSSNLSATDCAGKLLSFIQTYDLDGANIDYQDVSSFQKGGIAWLTQFTLALNSNDNNTQYIFSHSVDASLFDRAKLPMGDYSLIEKAVGQYINFYNVRYSSSTLNFSSY
jgi:hypothetical protein